MTSQVEKYAKRFLLIFLYIQAVHMSVVHSGGSGSKIFSWLPNR